MAWPAWPPPTLATNRTNATPQLDTHAADHNQIGTAVNSNIVPALNELHGLVNRYASGQAGLDFIKIDAAGTSKFILQTDRLERAELRTTPGEGALGTFFGSLFTNSWGMFSGDYNSTDMWPIMKIGVTTATGVSDPKYFIDFGSNIPAKRGRVRFLNIDAVEATVPWPVASSATLKAVEEVGELPDIRDLHVVRYTRLDDPTATERIGFVSEELADVLPEAAVVADPLDGPTAYLNEVVTALLVATVQNLLDRIEALEGATS